MTDDHTLESLISNNKSNPPILWSRSGLFFVQIQITYQMEELPWRNLNDIFHCAFNLTLRKKKTDSKENLRIRKKKRTKKKKKEKEERRVTCEEKIRVYFNFSTLIEIFHDMFISFRFRGFIKLWLLATAIFTNSIWFSKLIHTKLQTVRITTGVSGYNIEESLHVIFYQTKVPRFKCDTKQHWNYMQA